MSRSAGARTTMQRSGGLRLPRSRSYPTGQQPVVDDRWSSAVEVPLSLMTQTNLTASSREPRAATEARNPDEILRTLLMIEARWLHPHFSAGFLAV
jgi:hypothetical protein